MALKKHKTIQEALQYVADHPQQSTDVTLDAPVWELASRRLFHITNNPDSRVRGSMGRAVRAQKILLDRMVGRRRAGTHPAQSTTEGITFLDLTGIIETKAEDDDN